jgi:peptide deformylase
MEKVIVPFGDPLLRMNAEPEIKFSKELSKLIDDLTVTLYAAEGRAGLAAPQISVSKRVIVMDDGKGKIELINPEILEMQGEQTGPEACLSLPGYTGIVKRANYIKIKSMTRKKEEIFIEGEGFLARLIQHEMDHLDGVLYIDHIKDNQLYDNQSGQQVNLQEILRLSGHK